MGQKQEELYKNHHGAHVYEWHGYNLLIKLLFFTLRMKETFWVTVKVFFQTTFGGS